MKTFIFALLLGTSGVVMAAVVPEKGVVNGNVVVDKVPTIARGDMTKRAIMVDNVDADDVLTVEDFKELKRYSDIGRDENIEFVLNMQKRMQSEPGKLMADLGESSPNLNVATTEGMPRSKAKVGVSKEELQKNYQQAMEILEQRSRQKIGQQSAPIMMVPTEEEIKKLKLDRYLPEGWEEMLANSKEYQVELKKRSASGKKLDLNDPKVIEELLKSVQQKK